MTHHKVQEPTASEKLAAFITRNRKVLWAILALLIVATVAFAVVDSRMKTQSERYSNKAAALEESFQNWRTSSEDEKEAAGTALLEDLDPVVNTEEDNILVERALFIRGQFYYESEKWDAAAADYNKLAALFPVSYLAPVALYNEASALENKGDQAAALEVLEKLTADYKDTASLIPEALFNRGRLNELLGNKEKAVEAYEELSSSHGSSNWTNLAKTRIISLKASGVN